MNELILWFILGISSIGMCYCFGMGIIGLIRLRNMKPKIQFGRGI